MMWRAVIWKDVLQNVNLMKIAIFSLSRGVWAANLVATHYNPKQVASPTASTVFTHIVPGGVQQILTHGKLNVTLQDVPIVAHV